MKLFRLLLLVVLTVLFASGCYEDFPDRCNSQPGCDTSCPDGNCGEEDATDLSGDISIDVDDTSSDTCNCSDTGTCDTALDVYECGCDVPDKDIFTDTWDVEDSKDTHDSCDSHDTFDSNDTNDDKDEHHDSCDGDNDGEDETSDTGCTLTFGYWKTHNSFADKESKRIDWPLPFDEDQLLCETDYRTLLQLLETSPQGDAYIILAHQFIAASLNIANGASVPTAVRDALNEARVLIEENCGGGIFTNNEVRDRMIALANILDGYNNGLTGPGHCGDDNDDDHECHNHDSNHHHCDHGDSGHDSCNNHESDHEHCSN